MRRRRCTPEPRPSAASAAAPYPRGRSRRKSARADAGSTAVARCCRRASRRRSPWHRRDWPASPPPRRGRARDRDRRRAGDRRSRLRLAGSSSASRMMASSVCTARAGNAPAAVSPASMMASTPSSTALAASLTSARVGRASCVIDSSTCVARITGMPRRARPADDFLLHARHAFERHLESEIAARDHHRVAAARGSRRDARCASGRSSLAMSGTSAAPSAAINCRACRRSVGAPHEAERDHVDAERQAELQIVDVLRA